MTLVVVSPVAGAKVCLWLNKREHPDLLARDKHVMFWPKRVCGVVYNSSGYIFHPCTPECWLVSGTQNTARDGQTKNWIDETSRCRCLTPTYMCVYVYMHGNVVARTFHGLLKRVRLTTSVLGFFFLGAQRA